MRLVILGPIVVTLIRCQLDMIYELDVGTFIDLIRMAGRVVWNIETSRAAFLWFKRFTRDPINQKGTIANRFQWDTGMKIISVSVQSQMLGSSPYLNQFQQARQRDRISGTLRIILTDVSNLMLV